MSSNLKYALGTATVALLIGGAIYAVKKSKDAKKAEEESISLEDAKEIVSRGRSEETAKFTQDIEVNDDSDEDEEDDDDEEDDSKDSIIVAPHGRPNMKPPLSEVVEKIDNARNQESDDPLHDAYPNLIDDKERYVVEPLNSFYYHEEGINPKEDKVLRYDPNSVDAKHQFIRMELADWNPSEDTYRLMLQLFEFAFIPENNGDIDLRNRIVDYKTQFFGYNSRWINEVSFADVIFHYARNAEFNCGEDVRYWVEYFLGSIEIEWSSTSHQISNVLEQLNKHVYFNEERQCFGLFGLSRESMDQSIRIADENVDHSVTYEIEFNEFLKSCI